MVLKYSLKTQPINSLYEAETDINFFVSKNKILINSKPYSRKHTESNKKRQKIKKKEKHRQWWKKRRKCRNKKKNHTSMHWPWTKEAYYRPGVANTVLIK